MLSKFPDEYQTIMEILVDELYEKYHPLTIQRIQDKLSVKFDLMNE